MVVTPSADPADRTGAGGRFPDDTAFVRSHGRTTRLATHLGHVRNSVFPLKETLKSFFEFFTHDFFFCSAAQLFFACFILGEIGVQAVVGKPPSYSHGLGGEGEGESSKGQLFSGERGPMFFRLLIPAIDVFNGPDKSLGQRS